MKTDSKPDSKEKQRYTWLRYLGFGVGISLLMIAWSYTDSYERLELRTLTERDDLELYFDKDKLEKVMYNLLSNAFKFTPEQGKIWVTVTDRPSETGDAGEGLVEITVKDTGRGIPTEELPYIFDRFRQVGAAVREQEGTGIGLSLVKDLVALHGGTIRVTSEPGFGSAFIVSLPKGTAHLTSHELAEAEPDEIPTDDSSRPRVELAGLEGSGSADGAPGLGRCASQRGGRGDRNHSPGGRQRGRSGVRPGIPDRTLPGA